MSTLPSASHRRVYPYVPACSHPAFLAPPVKGSAPTHYLQMHPHGGSGGGDGGRLYLHSLHTETTYPRALPGMSRPRSLSSGRSNGAGDGGGEFAGPWGGASLESLSDGNRRTVSPSPLPPRTSIPHSHNSRTLTDSSALPRAQASLSALIERNMAWPHEVIGPSSATMSAGAKAAGHRGDAAPTTACTSPGMAVHAEAFDAGDSVKVRALFVRKAESGGSSGDGGGVGGEPVQQVDSSGFVVTPELPAPITRTVAVLVAASSSNRPGDTAAGATTTGASPVTKTVQLRFAIYARTWGPVAHLRLLGLCDSCLCYSLSLENARHHITRWAIELTPIVAADATRPSFLHIRPIEFDTTAVLPPMHARRAWDPASIGQPNTS